MTEAFNSLPTLLAIIGLVLITLEFAVFGFSTLFLIFIAIACLLSSLLMYLGLLPAELLVAAMSVSGFSLLTTLVLWKPLKKMQGKQQSPQEQPNVFAGLTFHLGNEITHEGGYTHKYSGIDWQVIPADGIAALAAGTKVEVVKTGVGKLYVKAAD